MLMSIMQATQSEDHDSFLSLFEIYTFVMRIADDGKMRNFNFILVDMNFSKITLTSFLFVFKNTSEPIHFFYNYFQSSINTPVKIKSNSIVDNN